MTSALPLNPVGPVVRMSPTTLSRWARCRHQYLLANVLPVPAVDGGTQANEGLKVHAVLRALHADGRSCHDRAWRDEVVATYDSGDGDRLRGFLDRHERKCPAGAQPLGHERGLARFLRQGPVMLMAYGTIDAIWLHDNLLDARDYKTGASRLDRVQDDPAAYVQAFLLAPLAAHYGVHLRIRYEFLSPEAGDDPEDFDVDADSLARIEKRLVATADRIRAEREFPGTDDPKTCDYCQFRSICSVRARAPEPVAAGEP